jgi:hypothetical protein
MVNNNNRPILFNDLMTIDQLEEKHLECIQAQIIKSSRKYLKKRSILDRHMNIFLRRRVHTGCVAVSTLCSRITRTLPGRLTDHYRNLPQIPV